MKRIIVACTLFVSALSSVAFAENGSDRLIERIEIRAQEVLTAKEKAQNDNQNTAKSDEKSRSKSS